jgi:Kef-type K+ transport system membrane component KefB
MDGRGGAEGFVEAALRGNNEPMNSRHVRAVGAGLMCVVASSCVFPARSYAAYAGKAVATATSTSAAVETALLMASVAREGKATAALASVTMADAESDAGSAQQTFASIQPPDGRSDALRSNLDAILSDAVDGIATLRIAARRGDLDRLWGLAAPLLHVRHQLQAFVDAHS